jgi:hypothetical protein
LCFLWAIPTTLYIINPTYSPPSWPTWGAFFSSVLLGFTDKRIFPLSVPFIALLSPLAITGRIFNLLPSELYIFACFIIGIVVFLAKRNTIINIFSGETYLLWLVILAFISFIASFHPQVLFKSMLSWVMIVTVFCLTRSSIKSMDDISTFFFTLIISVFYCSIISLFSFFNGINLSDYFASDIYNKQIWNNDHYLVFLRANYFYTNISFVIGPAAIFSFLKAFYSHKLKNKLFYGGLFVFFVSTLLMMLEKTGLVALIISLLLLFIMGSLTVGVNQQSGIMKKLVFFTIIPVGGLFVYNLISLFSNYSITIGGFIQRLCVFNSTLAVLIENPLHLFFGFGPDASNLLTNKFTVAAKTSCEGGIEGAIDSGHLTFLFEYGFIFPMLFLSYSIHSLYKIFKLLKTDSAQKVIYLGLIGIILYINIAAISDVIGTSKITWIIAQSFALTGLCIAKNSLQVR